MVLVHGAKAAKHYTKLIMQTRPTEDGSPSKNRSLAIGTAGAQPVVLVSPLKPTDAVTELKRMSRSQGSFTLVAQSQVVFEDNAVCVKAFKPATEQAVKKAFLQYYKTYKMTPPSNTIVLIQPNEWDAKEFEPDATELAAANDDKQEEDEDEDKQADVEAAEVRDEDLEKANDPKIELAVKLREAAQWIAALAERAKTDAKLPAVVQALKGKLSEAANLLKQGDVEAVATALRVIDNVLIRTGVKSAAPRETAVVDADDVADYWAREIQQAERRYAKAVQAAGADPRALRLLLGAKAELDRARVQFQNAGYEQIEGSIRAMDNVLLRAQQGGRANADDGQGAIDAKGVFMNDLKEVRATTDEANVIPPGSPGLEALRTELAAAKQKMNAHVGKGEFREATAALEEVETIARRMLLRRDIDASVPQKQLATQKAQYDQLSPVLDEVQRTYFNPKAAAGAAHLKKDGPKADKEFKAYITALEQLENLKDAAAEPPTAGQLSALKIAALAVSDAAQKYLGHFDADLSDKAKQDKGNLGCQQICTEALKAVRHYSMALELTEIGAPTDGKPWTSEQQIQAAQLRAQLSFETGYKKGGDLRASDTGGASAAFWIESAPPGEKATKNFIFKPILGEESPARDDRPGAGAAKEALASANAKLFEQMTGIDLGVPQTTVVTIGTYALNLEQDTQVTGPTAVGSMQEFAKSKGSVESNPTGTLRSVPAAACAKLAMNDIIGLNFDRHNGNFLVKDTGTGPTDLIPIDHGCTLPTLKDFKALSSRIGGLEDGRPHNCLLTMPGAFEKFDAKTIDQLALLDPTKMAAGMKNQLASLDTVNPGLGATGKVADESIEMSRRAMILMKKASAILSPAEIQIAIGQYGEQLFDPAADPNAVADQIIQAQAPKGAGYKEFFSLTAERRKEIAKTLEKNGWAPADDFLMKDPANALKLAKTGLAKGTFADAPTAAATVTEAAAETSFATAILATVRSRLPETRAAERAALTQREQDLTNALATGPADFKVFAASVRAIDTDVLDSVLLALRDEMEALHTQIDTIKGADANKTGDRRQNFQASYEAGLMATGALANLDAATNNRNIMVRKLNEKS
jgi:hypothetical protein